VDANEISVAFCRCLFSCSEYGGRNESTCGSVRTRSLWRPWKADWSNQSWIQFRSIRFVLNRDIYSCVLLVRRQLKRNTQTYIVVLMYGRRDQLCSTSYTPCEILPSLMTELSFFVASGVFARTARLRQYQLRFLNGHCLSPDMRDIRKPQCSTLFSVLSHKLYLRELWAKQQRFIGKVKQDRIIILLNR